MTGKRQTCKCTKGAIALTALLGLLAAATPAMATDMSNGSLASCSDTFFDSGGSAANYANSENLVFTYSPSPAGSSVRVTFSAFDVENNFDFLYVHSGPTTGDPLVATLTGTTLPGAITSTAPGGELTFHFTSDSSVSKPGWSATIDCVAPPTTGACCLTDGSCYDADEATCLSDGLYLAFGGLGTDCGTYACPLLNDECFGAIEITQLTINGTTVGSSNSAQQNTGCFGMSRDVWYWYEVTANGSVVIDSCGSAFDTELAVWDGCGGAELGCDDDDTGGCTPQSKVCIESATIGQILYIQVGYWSATGTTTGAITINVTPLGCEPPTGACCETDGSCTADTTQTICEAGGGSYLGDASTCAGAYCLGACCLTNATCVNTSELSCLADPLYDAWGGIGTDCATYTCPGPGEDCAHGLEIVALPFSTTDTTCGFGNSTSTTCLGSYDGGEDIFYKLILAADTCVDITMTPASTYSGIAIDDSCPLDPTTCIAKVSNSGTTPRVISGLSLTAGTYYIMIDTWPSPTCITSFDLLIEECPTGACCKDGLCNDITEAECLGTGGTYSGDFVPCTPDPCSSGACCVNGVCTDGSDLLTCDAAGGVYHGGGSSCAGIICNDECDGAIALSQTVTVIDNTGATTSADAVGAGCGFTTIYKDLWYTYTADCTGTVSISTCNIATNVDTKLVVYDGDACGPVGAVLGCDDDTEPPGCYVFASTVDGIDVTLGQILLIRVGTYGSTSTTAPITLTVACTPYPTGNCCNWTLFGTNCYDGDTEVECAARGISTWVEGGTCAVEGCPLGRCCFDTGAGYVCSDVSEADCNAQGGFWDGTTSCAADPCPDYPTNDDCATYTLVTDGDLPFNDWVDTSTAISGLPAASCDGSANKTQNDIWYCYSPASDCLLTATAAYDFDGLLAIYSGPDCLSLTEIDCLDTANDTTTFVAIGGTKYWFQIGQWGSAAGGGLATFDLDCAPPVTGACCDSAAGTCTDSDNLTCLGGGLTFYPGQLCVDTTCTGACCLTSGACLDIGQTACTAEPLYYSWGGEGTDCATANCPQPPTNDDCLNAIAITQTLTPFSTVFANTDGPVPVACFSQVYHDIWYTYTATCTGILTVATCEECSAGSSGYDTKIAVYDGFACPPTTELGCNDDGGVGACDCGLGSALEITVTAGQELLIRVGGYSTSSEGPGILFVDCLPVCNSCPGDVNGDTKLDGNDIQCFVDCLLGTAGPGCNCSCADFSVPADGVDMGDVAPFVDALLNGTGPCDPGRCCYDDGGPACSDVLTEIECLSLTGNWTVGVDCTTACPTGRCCYGDPITPSCSVITEAECTTLAGTWDGALDCTTACPVGRCCYGDPGAPTCQVMTEAGCTALAGDWDGALDCTTACPIAAGNDTCAFALPVACGTALVGQDLLTATNDYDPTSAGCTGFAALGPDLVYLVNEAVDTFVTVDMFNNVGFDASLYVVTDCADILGTCLAGSDDCNPTCTGGAEQITWTAMAGVNYYVIADKWGSTPPVIGTFDLTVSCIPVPAGGACCVPGLPNCVDDVADAAACTALGGTFMGAGTLCATSACPCDLVCDPGDTAEGEPVCFDDYVDATNGGCNSTPAVFGTITCGETVCGTSGNFLAGGGTSTRDTDWYKLVLATPQEVTWAVTAEFPVLAGIVNTCGVDDCAFATDLLVSSTADACAEASVTACLDAGTWYLFVSTSAFTGTACGAEYEATASCASCVVPTGACCDPALACTDSVTEAACCASGGTYLGDGTTCATSSCPIPGGDTCATAATIPSLPFTGIGSTVGMTNDYDEACPYSGSTSPDVVYSYTPAVGESITIDLCSSGYDTKVYVYEGTCPLPGTPLACDDDACGAGLGYTSFLTGVALTGGTTYYIVVDGYGGAAGDYTMTVTAP